MTCCRLNLFCSLIASMLIACGNLSADIADFEDVPVGKIPATPFVSGGLLFESEFNENGVFPPDVIPGANNGTQAFAWCGSNCGGGKTQIITVSDAGGGLFDLTSIDAGNLLPSGFGAGEWAEGMKIELLGFTDGDGIVSASLDIEENIFETFSLDDFIGLTRVEITAPPILKDGGGNPDPIIDNLVWNSTAVIPEPGLTTLATVTLVGCILRRRRST